MGVFLLNLVEVQEVDLDFKVCLIHKEIHFVTRNFGFKVLIILFPLFTNVEDSSFSSVYNCEKKFAEKLRSIMEEIIVSFHLSRERFFSPHGLFKSRL